MSYFFKLVLVSLPSNQRHAYCFRVLWLDEEEYACVHRGNDMEFCNGINHTTLPIRHEIPWRFTIQQLRSEKLLDDGGEIPKSQGRGWQFDSQL